MNRPILTRSIDVIAGTYLLIGGVTSFLGWAFDIRRFTDWDNNGISIQPNATICASLTGLALLLLASNRRRGAAAFGLIVLLIGGATGLEWITGFNLGIDSLFMFGREWGRMGVVVPGRMGPPGSLSWTLIGICLVLTASTTPARRWAPLIALVPLSLSLLSMTGYLYGVDVLYTLPRLTVIAFQTATFIAATSIGLIAAVSGAGTDALACRYPSDRPDCTASCAVHHPLADCVGLAAAAWRDLGVV